MKYWRNRHKGFTSTYFLQILLLFTTIMSAILYNDLQKLETLTYIKQTEDYFQQEILVIHDIRQRLKQDSLQESVDLNDFSYTLETDEATLYVEIQSTFPQQLTITYDTNLKQLLSYQCTRL